jgi:hypothetical protein
VFYFRYDFLILDCFIFATASRPAVGPTQPPLQWVLWAITPGVELSQSKVDHYPPSSSKIKNVWICIFTSPHYVFTTWCLVKQVVVFMAQCLVKHRDDCTLFLFVDYLLFTFTFLPMAHLLFRCLINTFLRNLVCSRWVSMCNLLTIWNSLFAFGTVIPSLFCASVWQISAMADAAFNLENKCCVMRLYFHCYSYIPIVENPWIVNISCKEVAGEFVYAFVIQRTEPR